MKPLKLVLLCCITSAVGCYAPDLPDCSIACTKDDDCAGGQVCTPQGRCAASGEQCNAETVDAGNGGTMDAGSGSSARTVTLKVQVGGPGKVTVANVGECGMPMCMFDVAPGHFQITATPANGKEFDKWTSLLCANQGETCETEILIGSTVAAKFK